VVIQRSRGRACSEHQALIDQEKLKESFFEED
jgi:hypothetical protein